MPHAAKLAEAVKARRHQLGLTPDLVKAAGGPSATVLSQIENAYDNDYRLPTLAKLDRALQWPAGTAAALWEGGELPSAPAVNDGELEAALDRLAGLIERVIPLLESIAPAGQRDE